MQATDRRTGATGVAQRRLDKALFDRLTAARGAKTIDEKAALLGLHRSTVFRLRAGTSDPGLATAIAIATTLGVKIERLFPARDKAAA